ncbi:MULTISPECIES: TetR/AcrR family transcriptional regulator [unclassified Pantoea]|uniref:TetR/AcrR family transcriptional regulator n=1 Tax=unclassified Pantoea TaxID=2630326 RepID=UPI001232E4CF|nr:MULTISPECIES: TetR/AcrR family transcriptional regulator [unclassified Pantoea]KAA6100210.1 TetR/AcrR family transcriptional regulator [Pantoea sp. B_9]KAA6116987.1 TetR/AcrR family transcriptional regulator [Pantoea sp. B_10]
MAARRRADQVEETRGKLIAAARRAFAQKGYSEASMDDLTAAAGLTRGALYHNFGDKKGLLQAVIDQIDGEILEQMRAAGQQYHTRWHAFLAEAITYIEMSLEPEVQRIMLLDGPAVLGDPSRWPNQTACLRTSAAMLAELIEEGTVKTVDTEAAAQLVNGAALNAALWIAAADEPVAALPRAVQAFRLLVSGLLVNPASH